MAFELNLRAVFDGVSTGVASAGYRDNVDNVDNVDNGITKNYPNYPEYPRYPVIHGLDTGAKPAPTAPPRPIPWFHLDAEWRKDYAAWQAHRDNCAVCRTSERTALTAGTGIRCAEGQRLHATYESALDSSPT